MVHMYNEQALMISELAHVSTSYPSRVAAASVCFIHWDTKCDIVFSESTSNKELWDYITWTHTHTQYPYGAFMNLSSVGQVL